jgi:hypothetical protein
VRINPKNLFWRAPTENEDGSPITSPLDYELGGVLDETTIVSLYTVVGSLQTDGSYQAPLGEMAFEPGEHGIALRAINRDLPELVSKWSAPVFFKVVAAPKPPLAVAVA